MADLTAAKRKNMPKSEFALSGERFPLNDKEHDRLAISGATRAERAGNISPAQESEVKSQARAKLGKKRDTVKSAVKNAAKRLKHV